jgi:hypothetical protein
MRKSQAFYSNLREILDRSFESARSGAYRPAVDELNALEAQLISEFTDDARNGVNEGEVSEFSEILKTVHGTRIALEEELTNLGDRLRSQLRPRK